MTHDKIVAYYAWKAIRRCPSLDIDDVKQDLAIAALEAQKQYDASSDLELTNFISRKLQWRMSDIIRNQCRRAKTEGSWANANYQPFVRPTERSYTSLCAEIVKVLDTKEKRQKNIRTRIKQARRLFQVLACSDNVIENRDKRRHTPIDVTNAACYLGFSNYNRILDEMRKAIKKVVDG